MESFNKLRAAAGKKFDAWANVLYGLGIKGRDKRMQTSVIHTILQQDDAEELYAGDDVARKVVDKIPHEGVRKGFEIIGVDKPDAIKKIGIRTKELKLMEKMEKAWNWARLYGGAGILIGVADGQENLGEPLDSKAVKKVNSLTVLHRWELTAVGGEVEKDLKSPNFGMPNFYTLSGNRAQNISQQIHYTRIIRFEGSKLPERKFETNQYWHDSVLSALNSTIRDFNMAHDTLPNVIAEFRVNILRLKGIADMLAAGKSDAVINRLQSFDLTKASYKTAVLDEDESYDIISKPLQGMKDIMDKIDNRLVAATGMPHTIVLGKSPGGSLSSKGDSENRDFMDLVAEQQTQVLTEPLIRVVTLLFAETEGGVTGGTVPEFGIQFNPLWQMDEKETADVHKLQSEADANYLTTGVLEPAEVAISRFGKGEFSLETTIDVKSRKPVTDSIDIDFDIEEEFERMREVNEICNAIDQGSFIVKETTDDAFDEIRGDQKRVLQTIIIMRSLADTLDKAVKEAKDFGKVVSSRSTENSFRFRQQTPGDFKKGSFKAFHPKGKQDVILLFGELK